MRRLTGGSDELANSSAEQPAECHSTDAADNDELAHFASDDDASPHFAIFDDADKRMDQEPDDWDIRIQHAPAAPEGIGMIWHRYQDPETKEIWFSCVTRPDLWCYESEVVLSSAKDGSAWFRFQGEWQQVVNPPRTEPAAATSTAAIQPNPTEGSGRAACTRGGTSINECAEYGHPHPCTLSDR